MDDSIINETKENLYPIDPSKEWSRSIDQLKSGLSQAVQVLISLSELDRDVQVRKTHSPDELMTLLQLNLPKEPQDLDQVITHLHQVLKHSPSTSTRRFFNQLFGGRDPSSLIGEIFAAFGNQSVYTYKVAAPFVLMEEYLLQKLGQMVGFTDGDKRCGGIFTPGGSLSNLSAMLCARDHCHPSWREEGQIHGRMYTSEEAHYSVCKGAGIIGLGRRNVVKVPCESNGCMSPSALLGLIKDDLNRNLKPMMVVATAGTTVRGCFDPFEQIAELCQSYNIWFHVDGAFGGSALFSPQFHNLTRGIALADSFTWDAHKTMGVPLTCSVLITKNPHACEQALSESASYLFQADSNELNPGVRSLQCGRRNDVLKLWAAWMYHGDYGWQRRLERQRNLALAFAQEVTKRERFKLCEDPPYLNVCFEVLSNDAKSSIDHEMLCHQLQIQQKALVGYAYFKDKIVVRAAIINPELTLKDLYILLDEIDVISDQISG